ncbi:hypothetical protein ACFPM0_30365 [Pseudonocardia sulfidoxydans]
MVVLGSAVAALATLGALFVAAPTSASPAPRNVPSAASGTERPAGSSTTSDQTLSLCQPVGRAGQGWCGVA